MLKAVYQHLLTVLTRNPMRLFFTMTLLVSGFSIVSLLFLVQKNVNRLSQSWSQQVEIVASVGEEATLAELNQLEGLLKSNPDITSYVAVSKDENKENFKKQFPELVQNPQELKILDETMTPSFKIKVKDPDLLSKTSEFLQNQSAIESATFGSGVAESLHSYVSFFRGFSFGSIVLLSLFSLVLIQLAIFMSVYSKKQVIEIFSLLGTPSSHIRIPFGVEGALLCSLAAGIGIAIGHGVLIALGHWLGTTTIGAEWSNKITSFSSSEILSVLMLAIFVGYFMGKQSTHLVLKEEA